MIDDYTLPFSELCLPLCISKTYFKRRKCSIINTHTLLSGAKLLGGVLLLGIGVAAVGVLCGASVVIVPAFAGYKYHRHRKFKRQLKRQQELIKMRSNNAMMELHRERERNRM